MRYYPAVGPAIPRTEAGRSRVTHPFAGYPLRDPRDLHVLSTPPAFVLSQDQTLRECLPVIGCTHHESGTARRNKPGRSQRPRCVYFKGTSPQPNGRERGINISGVDFWHAVEFSRNGRFLCTHPLGLSSGLPFGLAFPTLSDRFPIRFPRCFPGSRSRVSLSGDVDSIRSSVSLGPDSQSTGFVLAAVGPFRRFKP